MKKFFTVLMMILALGLFISCDDEDEETTDDPSDEDTLEVVSLYDTVWEVTSVGGGFEGSYAHGTIFYFTEGSSSFKQCSSANQTYSSQTVSVSEGEGDITFWVGTGSERTYNYSLSSTARTLRIESKTNSSTYLLFEESDSVTSADIAGYSQSRSDEHGLVWFMVHLEE